MHRWDLIITKPLLESRKFDYIEINFDTNQITNCPPINAKHLKVSIGSLNDILRTESIKADWLSCKLTNQRFNKSLFAIDVGSVTLL